MTGRAPSRVDQLLGNREMEPSPPNGGEEIVPGNQQ